MQPAARDDLAELVDLCSTSCNVPIPVSYPVFGKDAFRTGTGVHAAAVIKALDKGADWLADRVYSGVPASTFGKEQEIEIGPMSGMSNVRFWLARRRLPVTDELGRMILQRAKASNRTLEDDEVLAVVREAGVA